jgi:hypothetical protein
MVLASAPKKEPPNGCAGSQGVSEILLRDELVGWTDWDSQLLACSSKAHRASYTCDVHA